ncbi:MAG: Permease of the drug/metabolite transporter (DMT) superfamily, partial [uncultured Solirubrobacteraceae bacterium]
GGARRHLGRELPLHQGRPAGLLRAVSGLRAHRAGGARAAARRAAPQRTRRPARSRRLHRAARRPAGRRAVHAHHARRAVDPERSHRNPRRERADLDRRAGLHGLRAGRAPRPRRPRRPRLRTGRRRTAVRRRPRRGPPGRPRRVAGTSGRARLRGRRHRVQAPHGRRRSCCGRRRDDERQCGAHASPGTAHAADERGRRQRLGAPGARDPRDGPGLPDLLRPDRPGGTLACVARGLPLAAVRGRLRRLGPGRAGHRRHVRGPRAHRGWLLPRGGRAPAREPGPRARRRVRPQL